MRHKHVFTALIMSISLLLAVVPTHAANIHMHFSESVDVVLTENTFQVFSVTATEGDTLTIVAYGLDEGIVPQLSLFDTQGVTQAEDLNDGNAPVAAVQEAITETGIYTFLVSRSDEKGGLVRVMVFSGDPLQIGTTFIDTLDPFLPARAYLIDGEGEEAFTIQLNVVPDAEGNIVPSEIYASRGTDTTVPDLSERLAPNKVFRWVTSDGVVFYTLSVRATAETARKSQAYSSRQDVGLGFIQLILGEGGNLEFLLRMAARGRVTLTTALLAGPGGVYRARNGTADEGTIWEVVGQSGDYYLVVDPNSPTGGSWVRKDRIELIPDPLIEDLRNSHLFDDPTYGDLIQDAIDRLEELTNPDLLPILDPPPLTFDNSNPNPPNQPPLSN